MSGKVIVVTGASSGFGNLTVLELARRGHTVVATMRDVEGRNAKVRTDLIEAAMSEGHGLEVLEMDVADEASVDAAIEKVVKRYGKIDVLINNAGLMPVGITEAYTVADVERLFSVNFFGAVRTDRAVLQHMRAAGSGLLVHVTSLMGRVVFPFFGTYSASKFALEALAEAYRYELKGFGVDSVIVEPGPFPSNLISSSPEPSDQAVLTAYGDVAAVPGQIKAHANDGQDEANPPRPQLVADAIAKLVETTERRPLRTVVMPEGLDFGVHALNEAVRPIQNQMLTSFGMSEML
ncbi:SDR family oxidoreductase [Agrobacterium tumefaciens]|uniref:NAD(P)-dependent dehydrogenase (Short-subunit alcohol dehydrogenase family) n=1 Tax=Agrobacterium tumefaciens TaxID=358 RepID=A0AAW8M0Q3_AGRTU|nr:SDR family oxidoreductase [Agrobacterium tumefaciens]MBP2542460.1 NAD(P)-dependent dehydrogenase (short-subunit alcohol dehydrogenase family) [Agrobacterium tumefaciens]MBP2567991.1 NAD(P)-dependent dehydrogenase (short-subunit alcohol dehydrogenase family) [Agrobacterium tumefaciens]MDP9874101.1 NAD(P)-dependent dehydrogenase (short-subunit alcohol dehydrogenase family) [Agrobacterium tumefaciens]MDP9978697.1 NAD(P)-dependent dehydrogenase (short-subunit alcohol dehydrogenase family) [Agrob